MHENLDETQGGMPVSAGSVPNRDFFSPHLTAHGLYNSVSWKEKSTLKPCFDKPATQLPGWL